MENSVVNIVKRLIIKRGRATYWFVDDFVACGNYASVKKALQQLTNEHMLLRISNGVYYYPKIDRELGLGVLLPSKESTALAIAKHAGQTCGTESRTNRCFCTQCAWADDASTNSGRFSDQWSGTADRSWRRAMYQVLPFFFTAAF